VRYRQTAPDTTGRSRPRTPPTVPTARLIRIAVTVSPDDRPTPEDIAQAQSLIEEHDLQYVLADPLENQTAANQLVEQTDATEKLPLTAVAGQTQDWADKGWGYIDVMENINLATLQQALDA